MKYDLASIDYIIIALYFAIIWFFGFYISRKSRKGSSASSKEEFLLAGRRVTLPIFIMTLVATWYGNILGVGEFVYTSGIVAWVCFGLPYYIAAGLFAYFLAKKVRLSNVYTIPEQIKSRFGNTAGFISSLIVLIITIPAAYILMLGIIMQIFTGWSLLVCIILGVALSLAYISSGGFRADVYSNIAHFILMYIGFGVLLYFSVQKFGFLTDNLSKLPANHLKLTGGFQWQYILAWYIIAFQTFVDPSFHQRCSAAKTPKLAQKGILFSIGCWAVFDFLTLATGLYARAYYPGIDAVKSFPILGNEILPYFWKGLFIASMLSPIMAALDGYAFISAATIGNDILDPFMKKKKSSKYLTNIGLLITAVLGVILAVLLPSAVQLIYKTASIAVPALLIPLLLSFSTKFSVSPPKVIMIMVFSATASFVWTIGRILFVQVYFLQNVEPMIAGIIISLILSIFFVTKNKV